MERIAADTFSTHLVREEILAEFNFVILAVIREIQLIT